MQRENILSLFREILSIPTAPFHEYHVARHIREHLSRLPDVSLEQDSFGNLLALYRRGDHRPALAFGAHMDHPGWVRNPNPEIGETIMTTAPVFLGGVPEERLNRCDVEWFGEFGMWDLPPFDLRDGHIHARVCDDLIGCAAILAMFEDLSAQEIDASVYGIFTRAEEVGFVGAQKLAQSWPLSADVCFVSIETSAPRGGAVMGNGPVIRVGDRLSVFRDDVTGILIEAAKSARIDHQRALLDGGSCEATAMNLHGISAAGISVMLGNYHNCAPDGGIAPEYVALTDVEGLIALLIAAAERSSADSFGESAREALLTSLGERVSKNLPYEQAAQRFWIG